MLIFNTLKQFFKGKRYKVLLKKIFSKVFEKNKIETDLKWLNKNSISWEKYLKKIDLKIYKETKLIVDNLIYENNKRLSKLQVRLGGSANQYLLYFYIRKTKPSVIFETGVAAGHSSRAILYAIKKNKKGSLFSSDFPYFRIKNPEKYIGFLVEDDLKKNWQLGIEGDKLNISEFIKQVDNIDFFHYDSDKSYRGKQEIFSLVRGKMKKDNSIMIYDDIQDDNFFRDIIKENKFDFKVFSFENKYVGLIKF